MKKSRERSTHSRMAFVMGVWFAALAISCYPSSAQDKKPTARDIVAAIQEHIAIPWQKETVDTFKAGDPDTPVTGIAVTMMATMDVLQRAAANGQNFVITHEPTFYNHLDVPEGMDATDPVWKEKRDFIEKHGMVVWRFHDHWHRRKPDGILAGMIHELGWEKYEQEENPYLFTIPERTLESLVAEVAKKLGSPVVRVVGEPRMKLTRIAFSPGSAGFVRETRALEMNNVDVLLVGETREWETVEYAADAVSEGRKKALIVIGHIPSEQAGMDECARWLKAFVKEVPIEFVAAKQPYWTLAERAKTN